MFFLNDKAKLKPATGLRARIPIDIDVGRYSIRTVDSSEELLRVLRLRYEVFHGEFMNKPATDGVDYDEFDPLADHLIITDRKTDQIVGTYRVISSKFSPKFYSSHEFEIDGLLELPGEKLELGRACVKAAYRSGIVIHLLWRGLAEYASRLNVEYLFGCASIKSSAPADIVAVSRFLEQEGYMSSENLGIRPTLAYEIPKMDEHMRNCPTELSPDQCARVKELVPPLLETYFKAGAKVCGLPAYDPEFECIDFFTVLKFSSLQEMFRKRYINS
jgi:putative hemolysin